MVYMITPSGSAPEKVVIEAWDTMGIVLTHMDLWLFLH